ncbi:hypothetical protein OC846_001869 [Tilletia horrida]|uniref:Uncharacterized protein n=1 Tax=Tilletia horrida TaxID=155126 RepID=A0AAN6GUM4_9BASI|nr:hypothetical protein OC846_001869 [Tilletia horrida]
MSINWVLTTVDGTRPEPLPAEKIIYRSPLCQLNLEFKNVADPAKWNAEGSVTVTNQRVGIKKRPHKFVEAITLTPVSPVQQIIFLRLPPLPPPADPSQPSEHLRNLAIPLLGNLLSVKYSMPIFAAPHLELKIHPVRGGGLPQDAVLQRGMARDAVEKLAGVLKLSFRDGGGTILKDAIDRGLATAIPLAGVDRPRAEPDPLQGVREFFIALYQAPPGAPPHSETSPAAVGNTDTSATSEQAGQQVDPQQLQSVSIADEPPPYAAS